MPVFTEYSTSSHDLRVLPSFAPPVPRLSPKFEQAGARERYELVIAGVRLLSVFEGRVANPFLGRTCWPLS